MLKRSVIAVFFMSLVLASSAFASCPLPTIWDSIVKANVDKDGYVDYDSIRIGKGGDLYEYLSFLETADVKSCSEPERLAFWINAYNAHMIKMVLARASMKEVSDDFNLFDEKFKVARLTVSLNQIEHQIIRSDSKKGGPVEGFSMKELDPRIHFALVCGAVDCPKLLNKAYVANSLEATLQSNAVQFANNPKHLRLDGASLVVSTLMKWYADDFDKLGGVAAYLTSLTNPTLRPDANEIDGLLKTGYPGNAAFKYDWTLNSIKNKKPALPVSK